MKLIKPDQHPKTSGEVKCIPNESFDVSLFQDTFNSNGASVDTCKIKGFSGNEASMLLIENEIYPDYCSGNSETTRWMLIYQPDE